MEGGLERFSDEEVVEFLLTLGTPRKDVKIPARDSLLFDYQLQKQVLAFQRKHGLVPDGIVGKNTIVHLNTAIDRENVPRLTGR